MKMYRSVSLLALVLLATMVPASVSAATITLITTPLASPVASEDFEDATFDPFFTFTASSGIRQFSGSGINHAGSFGLTTNRFPDTITVGFAAPVLTAGMWFGNDDLCCSTGFTAFLDVYGAGNVLLGTVGIVANMNDLNDQFLGFISDTPVFSTTIRYGSGSNVALFIGIDDVQAGASVVPEPGTLLLLGTGLAAGLRRLKKRT